jgi:hypothetical protein
MTFHQWVAVYGMALLLLLTFWRGRRMFDVNEMEKEVANELKDERLKKAKSQLKEKLRQIENANLILANLEREKADLLVAISDGTN